MCLIIERQPPKIAKEDFAVYKVLTTEGSACIQSFHYEMNKLYSTNIEECNDFSVADEKSLQYIRKKYGIHWSAKHVRDSFNLISLGVGYHSCNTPERAKSLKEEYGYYFTIFIAIIPKDSQYYEDPTGLIVSNQIIIKHKYDELPNN